jgi:ADP-heptose:LPS heptosyltransferase
MSGAEEQLHERLLALRKGKGQAKKTPVSGERPEWERLLDKALQAPVQATPGAAPLGARVSASEAVNRAGEAGETRVVSLQAGPASLVVLRPDSLGDAILFEPFLRVLREAWPKTQVHVLCTAGTKALAGMMPEGIAWHVVEGGSPFLVPGEDSVAHLREVLKTTGSGAWLVSACARKTWWDMAAPSLVRFDRCISLGPVPFSEGLRRVLVQAGTVPTLAAYAENVSVPAELHELEKNLELAGYLLGCAAGGRTPRLSVPAEAVAVARELLAGLGLESGRFVACCPAGTANVAIKTWPAARFALVLAQVQRERGLKTLLLGSEAEAGLLRAVEAEIVKAGGAAAVWLGQGHGDLETLCGLLGEAALYLGNDTGPMHAAAALGRPVVGVFGGGTWPRFTPRARSGAAVVRPMPCFGCDWQCHLGSAPCIQLIETDTVLRAVATALDGEQEGTVVIEEGGHPAPEINRLALGASRHARSLRGQIEHMGLVTCEQQGYITQLEGEREARTQELQALLVSSGKERETAVAAAGLTQAELQRLGSVLAQQQGYISQLESERDARTSELQALRTSSDLARKAAEEAAGLTQAELQRLGSVLAQQQSYISELESKRETAQAAAGLTQAELQRLGSVLAEQQGYISRLESERDARAQELQAALVLSGKERETAQAAAGLTQAELQRLGSVLAEQQGYISQLESERDARTSELQALRSSTDVERDAAKKASDQLAEEHQRLGAVLGQQQEYIAQLESDRATKARELEASTAANREISALKLEASGLLAEQQRLLSVLAEQQTYIEVLELQKSVAERQRAYIAQLEGERDAKAREGAQSAAAAATAAREIARLLEEQGRILSVVAEQQTSIAQITQEKKALEAEREAQARALLELGVSSERETERLLEEQRRLHSVLAEQQGLLAQHEDEREAKTRELERVAAAAGREVAALGGQLEAERAGRLEQTERIAELQGALAGAQELAAYLARQYEAAAAAARTDGDART